MGDQAVTPIQPSAPPSGAMVPVFAPDGTLGDIPQERLQDAVKAGGKPGVNFLAPDGTKGVIPADKLQEASAAGGKPIPLEDEKPAGKLGFLSTLGSDLKRMVTSYPQAQNPYPGMGQDEKAAAAGESYERDQSRKAAGYSRAYRAVAPIAESVGADVSGMEQSAKEGDQGGVLGHAVASAVPAIATFGAEDVGKLGGSAASKAVETVRNVSPKQVAQTIGGVGGAVAGHGTLSAPGAYYGAKTVGRVAEGLLGKERANAPIFSKPAPVYPGAHLPLAPDPGIFHGPSAPSAELTSSTSLATAPTPKAIPAAQSGEALGSVDKAGQAVTPVSVPNKPAAAVQPIGEATEQNLKKMSKLELSKVGEQRAIDLTDGHDPEGMGAIGGSKTAIYSILEDLGSRNESSPAAIQAGGPRPTVAAIANQVESALGGRRLTPNVPLKYQRAVPLIEPEHMGQFARANGLDLHQAIPDTPQGDVLRAKIHGLSNVEVRQLAINAGEDMGQSRVGNRKGTDDVPRQEVLQRVIARHTPEQIGRMIDKGQHLAAPR